MSPEEGVVFYTHFPKLLRSLIIGQLEANGTLIMLQLGQKNKTLVRIEQVLMKVSLCGSLVYLWWTYLNEKAAAFVGDFQHFWPRKAIDPQLVFINHESTGADTQHDIHPIQILRERNMSISPVIYSTGYIQCLHSESYVRGLSSS